MITAIIVSKNNADTLDACLKSVVESLPDDKEIIVVDAHSSDQTPNVLKKYEHKIQVVYDEGIGLGNARNIGVKHSDGSVIAFVDSDVVCSKDHFLKIEQHFAENLRVGALDTTGTPPVIGTGVQKLEALFEVTAGTGSSMRGWSIAFRRSVFDVVGGFCRGGAEDSDFTIKVKLKDFQVAHIRTDSWHIPRRTMRALLKEMISYARDGAYLYYKWGNTQVFMRNNGKPRLYRLIPNTRVLSIVAYFGAPFSGLKYMRKAKNMKLYLYFIVRQYAWLYGFLLGNVDIALKNQRFLNAMM